MGIKLQQNAKPRVGLALIYIKKKIVVLDLKLKDPAITDTSRWQNKVPIHFYYLAT